MTESSVLSDTIVGMNYDIRPITEDDMPAIAALYNHCFDADRSVEATRAKFDTRPTGHPLTGHVALSEEGDVVSFCGLVPVEMRVGGERILGAQSVDVMTHPDHRKAGLYVDVAQRTYDLGASRGIKVVFAFPNKNSLHGLRHNLGWEIRGEMVGLSMRRSWWHRLVKRGVVNVHAEVDRLTIDAKHVLDLEFDGVAKTAPYLDYKAVCSGSRLIEFEDLIVWLKPGDRLDVASFAWTGEDGPSDRKLFQSFQRLMQSLGASSIRFCFTANHPLLKLIKPHCKAHPSTPFGLKALDKNLEVPELHICRGDFDYF